MYTCVHAYTQGYQIARDITVECDITKSYVYICMYTTQLYIYICITHINIYMYACIYLYTYIYVYICIYRDTK